MQNNPIAWFEIYVADMDRARAFYEAVFQIKLQDLAAPSAPDDRPPAAPMTMWAFPMSEQDYGASGALVQMAGVAPGGGGTLVYFGCEDCAVEAARAAANRGKVIQQKMPIGEYGFIALVEDTEGNTIGLHSMQ